MFINDIIRIKLVGINNRQTRWCHIHSGRRETLAWCH